MGGPAVQVAGGRRSGWAKKRSILFRGRGLRSQNRKFNPGDGEWRLNSKQPISSPYFLGGRHFPENWMNIFGVKGQAPCIHN